MKFWILLTALLVGSAPDRQSAPAPVAPVAPLDQKMLLRHIAYLADDAREGRAPGTEGGNQAAAYIASQLAGIGLGPGAPDGSWYQPVSLVERRPGAFRQSWKVRGRAVTIAEDQAQFVARDGQASLSKAPVIFAGHGLVMPDAGYDDLAGADVRDKIVMILSGRPKDAPNAPGLAERRELIAERGAAAVIALSAADDPWDLIRDRLAAGRTTKGGGHEAPVEGALAATAWQAFLRKSGYDPAALIAAAAKPGFRAKQLPLSLDVTATGSVRRFQSYNVVGRLVGTDRPGEAVVLTAHWDHLGLCRPADAPDRVCNGAIDNASGVAMMIEVARALAKGKKPRRSIYVVATTAEELGLIGVQAFVKDPPLPLDHIAAALNMDTVALVPAGAPIAVIGRGRTGLDPLIEAAARIQRRAMDEDDAANAFITRQDGWPLLQAGVPAVMIGGAFSDPVRLASFLSGNYHSPADDLSHGLELGGAAEDTALHIVLARMAADPARLPLKRAEAR